MAILQIDTAELLAKSQTVEATLGRIQTDVSSMESQLRQLQESWKGSASAAFQDVLTQWRSTQVQVEQSLASVRQAMASASSQYEETESANTRMFGH
ncbi:WXG100 family type VII secretion target [Nesterenkonia sandarakina]|uniref:ESAT-6-like protein n=1 Tax=Nesterenkonia sandarakina TaxID=272918 RepID=A0A2T0YFM9_9MICC|nr:WXG100 family type VII secretion target [Nesterenkonia sandarakina]PRZ13725.1 WXG100 family type VII secretion target [Nesterenkonia sandarakina]